MIGYFALGETEIVNNVRTLTYLNRGLLNDSRVSARVCDCDAINEGFIAPGTDEAPWYEPTRHSVSDGFLGIVADLVEISTPTTRSIVPRSDGQAIGRLRTTGRTVSVQGLMYAASAESMEYGRRWLTEALQGSQCSADNPCGLDDVCVLPVCPTQAANLILDPSFEESLGLENDSNSAVTRSTTQAAHGTYSARLADLVGGTMIVRATKRIPVQAGLEMTALASFRANTTGRNARVLIRWIDSNGVTLSESNGTNVADVSTGFTQAFVTATAPDNAVEALLMVVVASLVAGEVHFVDKLSLHYGDSTTWTTNQDSGFRNLVRAGLIDGPIFTPIEGIPEDLVVGVSFQVAAEQSFLYQEPIELWRERSLATECVRLSTEQWIGEATAEIVVRAGTPQRLEGVRVTATSAKDGVCVIPDEGVLGTAEAYWRAADSSSSSVPDGTGNAHDLSFPGGAADPLFLEPGPDGRQFVYLPGSASNNLSAADTAALSLVGDITLDIELTAYDWTPAAVRILVSKYGSAGQRSWKFELLTTGILRITWSADGTALLTADSTVAVGFTDSTRHWVRASLDVNNGAAGRNIKFYTSDDGVTWTQLGATVTQAGVTSVFDSTSGIFLGKDASGGSVLEGNFYRFRMYNGIEGTGSLIADLDLSDKSTLTPATTAWNDSTGNAWTITRSATGRKVAVVDRALFLFGTDDYLFRADDADLDFGATDSFTIIFAGRLYGTTIDQHLVSKRPNTGVSAGYALARGATANRIEFAILDGATFAVDIAPVAITQGAALVLGGVRRASDDEIEVFANNSLSGTPSPDTTTATLANASQFRISSTAGGSQFADMEWFGAAIFRRALTSQEIAAAGSELVAGAAITTANPCMDLTIDSLPPGTDLVIDGTTREAYVRHSGSHERVANALAFVTFADGIPTFPDLGPCAQMCVCVDVVGATLNADSEVSVSQVNREL